MHHACYQSFAHRLRLHETRPRLATHAMTLHSTMTQWQQEWRFGVDSHFQQSHYRQCNKNACWRHLAWLTLNLEPPKLKRSWIHTLDRMFHVTFKTWILDPRSYAKTTNQQNPISTVKPQTQYSRLPFSACWASGLRAAGWVSVHSAWHWKTSFGSV